MNLDFLKELRTSGYQKDNLNKFLKKIGFSYSIPSIHIAGTNGKGTTGTIIQNIYKEHGYKTGYFHSPYLYDPLEMIRVNGEAISEEDFYSIFNENKKYILKCELSEFEVETFIALTYFQKVGCDIAVIECGMGGRFDATNIFDPILSIITSISIEHTSFLGSSISEISYQKGGIIKEKVPVLLGNLCDEAKCALAEIAKENGSEIISPYHIYNENISLNGITFSFEEMTDLYLPSIAKYNLRNLEVSLTAIYSLKEGFLVTKNDIQKGLDKSVLIGRMEIVKRKPLVIVDGAHNPEAIYSLKLAVESLSIQTPIHIIFAAFKDKNVVTMLPYLNTLTSDISLTTFNHPRARNKDDYFILLDDYSFEEDHVKLIKEKIKMYPEDTFLICGSLAFAGLVSKEFKDGTYDQ